MENFPGLTGLYQVSSEPINKFDLLHLLRDAFSLDVGIEEEPNVQIDRSLDSNRFKTTTGFEPATWIDMIRDLAEESPLYH